MHKIKQPKLYNVGIKRFDEEHQKLVEMVNLLHQETVDKEQDLVAHKLIVSVLVNFAREHFDGEEEYMRRINYPDLDKHQQCHRVIYTQLLDLERRFETSTVPVATHALQFLLNWLDEHTLTEDKLYAEYALKYA